MRKAIGITGGIATGKSTVTKVLQRQGFTIVDADQIARMVVLPQTEGWQKIVNCFGMRILQEDGQLNRSYLGQLVFNNPPYLDQLNQILQPLIRQRLTDLIKKVSDNGVPVFFEIPLLYEQHYQQLLDQIILVYAAPSLQLQRLQTRNHLTLAAAQQRIASQMSLSQKSRWADFIIDNNGDLHYLQKQIDQMLELLI